MPHLRWGARRSRLISVRLLARRCAEVCGERTVVLDRHEVVDIADADQRELADYALAGDSVASRVNARRAAPSGRHSSLKLAQFGGQP
jgi:hypothetical protein